jgi:hypothetical protein
MLLQSTAGVTRLGWEGGFTVETGFCRSQKNAQKRAAYPKSDMFCQEAGEVQEREDRADR